MHKTMKLTLATLALLPAGVSAHTVKAPHPGTVTATTYTSSGAFHGAVDISNCYASLYSGVVGSLSWTVTIRSVGTGCNLPTNNEAKHLFADGWSFRITNFVKTADSYSRTCDNCMLGQAGIHTHLQKDKVGTNDTSWYSGYTTQGESVDRTETIGILD
ncbi:MAG TPA: hypothetical protein VF794_38435 [Archangium sp.]|jgi:hypothetical protein|uniref:hypothetical protein n=1 Tax=Archangium sp. TaxID=1872627 RepID=UPI002ED9C99F